MTALLHKTLFTQFMAQATNPESDAAADIARETQRYIYNYDRIQRRLKPLLNILASLGIDVDPAQEINRSAIKGTHATLYAMIQYPNAMLPEARIKIFCPLRTEKGRAEHMPQIADAGLTHTSCEIVIKPLGLEFTITDRRDKGIDTKNLKISAPSFAAMQLRSYLYRAMPDFSGRIVSQANLPPAPGKGP